MKIFTSPKQQIGLKGEKAAEMFLVKHGFTVIDRNYSTRFGEIDLITTKNGRIHFFEVKTVTVTHETQSNKNNRVSCETILSKYLDVTPAYRTGRHETKGSVINNENRIVSRERFIRENRKLINPFQNVSYFKTKRLVKTAEIYMRMNNVPRETRWQVDGIGVHLYPKPQEPKIEYLPNINII